MATTVLDVIRIKKHKTAKIYYSYDWGESWLRSGDSLSQTVGNHSFEDVDAASGLTVGDKDVDGNITYCSISGGNASIAEWRVRITVVGTLDPDETGVIELWITVWGD